MEINKNGYLGIDLERRAFDQYRVRCRASGETPFMLDYVEATQSIDERIAYIDKITGGSPRPFTWELGRQLVAEGKLQKPLESIIQLIGDCVAVSTAKALEALSIVEVALERQEEKVWFPNPSWHYAVGRAFIAETKMADRMGRNSDGMVGQWAAEAVNKFGVLFQEYPGVPAYSTETTKWGHCNYFRNQNADWYVKYKDLAKPHTVKIVRCNSFADGMKVFKAGGTLTIASNWGFTMKYVGDRHCYIRNLRDPWMHQMYFTDYVESPSFTGWYRMNQWPLIDTVAPKNGEVPGGAWQSADDIEKELKGGQQELYGYLCLEGKEGDPNWGLI